MQKLGNAGKKFRELIGVLLLVRMQSLSLKQRVLS